MDVTDVSGMMPTVDGFPRPDWPAIYEAFGNVREQDVHDAYCRIGRAWIERLADFLGDAYSAIETDEFFILSCLGEREGKLFAQFVERSRSRILLKLEGIAQDEGYGKHIVLLFSTEESYYQYVSHFYPDEGDFPMSAGMFLNVEYGHMVIPHYSLYDTEATFAHEFTHACLRNLPIPVWLDEGLALTLEHELCGNKPLEMDKKKMAEHRKFWDAGTIQEFWNGTSFSRVDNGVTLSYELGRFCVTALAHDLDEFARFANKANYSDGGEAAAVHVYEGSLGGLPFQFFGEGDWCPNPEDWWPDDSGVNES